MLPYFNTKKGKVNHFSQDLFFQKTITVIMQINTLNTKEIKEKLSA